MSDRGGWIQTYTGRQFWPLDAHIDEVDIEDVAHALANTCRYGGHTVRYYSVAQHSVLVSLTCKPENALWGLLHDAAEAYLGDMVRPIKHGPGLEKFRDYEEDLMRVIAQRFHLSEGEPPDVAWADSCLLATEKRDLLRKMQTDLGETEWLHGAANIKPLSAPICPVSPLEAEGMFLERFEELWRSPRFKVLGYHGAIKRRRHPVDI